MCEVEKRHLERRRANLLFRVCREQVTVAEAVSWAVEESIDSLSQEAIECYRRFDYDEAIQLADEWLRDVFEKESQPADVVGWNFGVGDYSEEHPLYGMYFAGYGKFDFESGLLVAEYGWLPDRRCVYDQFFFQETTRHCADLTNGVGLFLSKMYTVALAIKMGSVLSTVVDFSTRQSYPVGCSVDGVGEVLLIGNLTESGLGPLSLEQL